MMQPSVYNKPLPVDLTNLNLDGLGREVTQVVGRLQDRDTLSKDLKLIQSRGIPQRQLANLFNRTTRTIRRWKSGKHTPKELDHILLIRGIAKCIREREEEQRASGLRPQVVHC